GAPRGPRRTGGGEELGDGELPAHAELLSKTRGRVVAALEAPVALGRDEGERIGVGPRDRLGDDLPGEPREAAQAALLPGRYERLDGVVIGERRARRGVGKPPTRALAAAGHGPCGRCAAPRAP